MQQFLYSALRFIVHDTKVTDWLISLATAAYAVIAGFQWRAIGEQAKVANRALLLAQRPKLRVRNVVVTLSDTVRIGSPVRGQLYVENVGGSTASITEMGCWIAHIRGNLPMQRMYEGQDPSNPEILNTIKDRHGHAQLRPGESGTVSLLQSGTILELDYVTPATPEPHRTQRLYVYGWIHYSDAMGIVHRYAFCREFDTALERFVPVDNPDYEYAE